MQSLVSLHSLHTTCFPTRDSRIFERRKGLKSPSHISLAGKWQGGIRPVLAAMVVDAADAPKFSDFLSSVQSAPEKGQTDLEGLSAKERRKLRNEKREQLKATKEPWKEMVENKLLSKPKKKSKNWQVDADVNQLTAKGMQWWMIQTTRKFENHVAEQLDIIFPETFPDREYEVLVPTLPVKSKLKDGSASESRKKIFQGIVLLRCVMDRDVYDLVRRIPRAYDFFGNLAGVSYQPMIMPAPVSHTNMGNLFRQIKQGEEEFQIFKEQCRREVEEERRKAEELEAQNAESLPLNIGATIRVLSGPFSEFSGIVTEMLPEANKVKAMVTVFGKDTPIVLDVEQVEVTAAAPMYI
ncbi:hypothetical protein R1sor_023401 [Riccia sorocarpa]|uniref:NusG-like N-terminal domain-containing protein n=1 Tax=Riccia sorocarpa TaxID=122646 RepID=A0ABD3GMI7_9MARC